MSYSIPSVLRQLEDYGFPVFELRHTNLPAGQAYAAHSSRWRLDQHGNPDLSMPGIHIEVYGPTPMAAVEALVAEARQRTIHSHPVAS